MAKNIIKEIIIILLLTLAIILILGVLLYEYVPANKIIPEKVSYITPENVKNELETSDNVDETQLDITYHIDSTDLTNYKRTQDYVPGKKNPFSSLTDNTTNNTTENGENTSSGTQNTTNTKNTTTSENTNTGYLPNKGTK